MFEERYGLSEAVYVDVPRHLILKRLDPPYQQFPLQKDQRFVSHTILILQI
jgi:hypothetical protein